jgi:hypothetical protein
MMYNPGDIVVVRTEDIHQVAIVTNVHRKKNTITGYDVRSEKGSAYLVVSVDKPKDLYSINSTLTEVWKQNTDTPTNLAFNRHIGHTRANYGELVRKEIDPDRHYEKCNDFSFPVVGERSW